MSGLNGSSVFTPAEQRLLRRLSTPEKIQRFLDEEVQYNKEHGRRTCRSPRRVMRDRLGQCMEGALFGAAALSFHGHPPLVVDLEAVRDDDHVLAVFRSRGLWGAVAKSNFSGLRYREPVYRTLRELVMSYFEHYYNLRREKTLRRYSRPLSLNLFDDISWRTTETDLWVIAERLVEAPHFSVIPSSAERRLTRMDRRLFEAGRLGAVV
jgi:hypothetical protein